ncbi:MAG TPA: hypothetical protein VEH28_06675 [Thermoplasmata archaeon]|nr:hypothetical protein [Thermoplasmata archaeon]
MRRASRSEIPVLGTVLVAGLMVFVLASTPVEAAPVPASSTSLGHWSYGNLTVIRVPLQHAAGGWMYQGNAAFGYTVTIYENATSASTLELTVFRTMGLSFSVKFCTPSCSSPLQWANESFRLYESTTTFANFTDQGSVTENGTTPVLAIALDNTTSFLHANLTESSDNYLPSLGQRGPHLTYLGADLKAHSTISFTPALGLFPSNPSDLVPGSTWNSTSDFRQSGDAAYSWYYAAHAPIGPVILGPISGHISVATSGDVGLQGSYRDGSTFPYGGYDYPAISLIVTGPFDVREGFIFVPNSADVFGSSALPWGGNQSGAASAQMATLDVKPVSGDQLQLVASSWAFASSTANAGTPTSVTPGTSGLLPASVSSNPVTSGTLQGYPESDDQASSYQQCLVTGNGCSSNSGPNLRGIVADIALVGVTATVAVIAVVLVTRRRRAPPPVYPNAVLYPPGAAYPSAPAGTPQPPAAPPPPEDDPLDHLW